MVEGGRVPSYETAVAQKANHRRPYAGPTYDLMDVPVLTHLFCRLWNQDFQILQRIGYTGMDVAIFLVRFSHRHTRRLKYFPGHYF
jgi:hypothetical protein